MSEWVSLAVVGRDLIDLLAPGDQDLATALDAALAAAEDEPRLREALAAISELQTFGRDVRAIHLFAVEPWQHALARVIANQAHGPAVRVTYVPSGSLAEHLGDHLGGLLGEAGDVRHVFNVAGVDPASLAPLLDAYRIPMLHRRPDGTWFHVEAAPFPRSRLLGALHLCQTSTDDADARDRVDSNGYRGLVARVPGTGYRPTRALIALLHDDELLAPRDYHSATADLLERRGDVVRAERLREFIRLWLRNRLWAVNFVPEMVLHDENHSAAVDRNVAYLCEDIVDPFTEQSEDPARGLHRRSQSGAVRLSTRDLFLLGVSAWLHDWGHASALVDKILEEDPLVVRELHGYLTSLKLENERGSHGLAESGEEEDLHEVALLCAHHQGKSSCGDDASTSLRGFAKGIGWPSGYQPGRSFRSHCADVLDPGNRNADAFESRYERLRVLLALLRVADAADIGVHRVTDFANQRGNKDPLVASLVSHAHNRLFWIEQMADRTSLNVQRGAVPQLYNNVGSFRELMARIDTSQIWSENDVLDIVEQFEREEKKTSSNRDLIEQIGTPEWAAADEVERVWRYSRHVAISVGFFKSHHKIRATVPFLRERDGALQLCLAAVVDRSVDASAGERDKAKTYLKDIIFREFGRKSGTRKLFDPAKQSIELAFESLGVDTSSIGFVWADELLVHASANAGTADGAKSVPAPDETARTFSPDGGVAAWLERGAVIFAPTADPDRVARRASKMAQELLAVEAEGSSMVRARALVSSDHGTAIVPLTSEQRVLRIETRPVPAGALIGEVAVLASDGSAYELDLRYRTKKITRPVHWMTATNASQLDSLQWAGRTFVALRSDEDPVVHAAERLMDGRWVPLRSLGFTEPPVRVTWLHRAGGPVLGVTLADTEQRFRLDGAQWFAV